MDQEDRPIALSKMYPAKMPTEKKLKNEISHNKKGIHADMIIGELNVTYT